MNMDTSWWEKLFTGLAVEAGGISAVTWLALRASKRPHLHRQILRAAIVAWICLWTAEFIGVRQVIRPRPLFRSNHSNVQETLGITATRPARATLFTGTAGSSPQYIPTSTAGLEGIALTVTDIPQPTIGMSPRLGTHSIYWPGCIWVSGVLLLGGRAAIGRFLLGNKLGQLHRRGSCVRQSPMDIASIHRLEKSLGLKPVRLLSMAGLEGPIATGIWWPTIVLPTDFANRFTSTQREAVLAHELAHLASRDPIWLLAADILAVWAWWHPAAYWLGRQLRRASELSADEASHMIYGGPIALAEVLVALGKTISNSTPSYAMDATGTGSKSHLSLRIEALLAGDSENRIRHRSMVPVVSLPVILATGLAFAPLPTPDVLATIKGLARNEPRPAATTPEAQPETPAARIIGIAMNTRGTASIPASDPNDSSKALGPEFLKMAHVSQKPSAPPIPQTNLLGTVASYATFVVPKKVSIQCTYAHLSDGVAMAVGLSQLLPNIESSAFTIRTNVFPISHSVTGQIETYPSISNTNRWHQLLREDFQNVSRLLCTVGGTNIVRSPPIEVLNTATQFALLNQGKTVKLHANGDFPSDLNVALAGPIFHASLFDASGLSKRLLLVSAARDYIPGSQPVPTTGALPTSDSVGWRSIQVLADCRDGDVLIMALPPREGSDQTLARGKENTTDYIIAEVSVALP